MSFRARLIEHVFLPLYERHKRRSVLGPLRSLRSSQHMDRRSLETLRLRKLRALVDHAYRHTGLYRERMQEAGLSPDDIRSLLDLGRFPVLTKSDLQNRLVDLVANNLPPEAIHRSATGGSTGEHTPFYRNNACIGQKIALERRFNTWAGWRVGEPIAYVWPALQDFTGGDSWKASLRSALIDRSLMLNAGHLDEATLSDHAKRLHSFRPVLIRAFPNPLSILARYLRDTQCPPIRPRGIITVGEPLLESHRELFEDVFASPVFNCYVSRECGNIACECEVHSGLHVNAESLIVEFVRDGMPVNPGEPGQILVTDLENYGMPFIRYQIGDLGVPLNGSCTCGRVLPLMAMNAGRVSDFVISPHDGSYVSGATLCHYLIAEGPQVGQVQIIQDAPNNLTIKIAQNGRDIQPDTAHFDLVIGRIFANKMQVRYEWVETIPRERSGKYRFCISHVSQAL